jgi:hypothetical protein
MQLSIIVKVNRFLLFFFFFLFTNAPRSSTFHSSSLAPTCSLTSRFDSISINSCHRIDSNLRFSFFFLSARRVHSSLNHLSFYQHIYYQINSAHRIKVNQIEGFSSINVHMYTRRRRNGRGHERERQRERQRQRLRKKVLFNLSRLSNV